MTDKSISARSTAMFVRVLGKILRTHMPLTFEVHEHWDFEFNAEFDAPCGLVHRLKCSRYIGIGGAKVRGLDIEDASAIYPIDIRAYIERASILKLPNNNNDLWTFHVWVKVPDGGLHPVSCGYIERDDLLYGIDPNDLKRTPSTIMQWWRADFHESVE